MTQVFGLDDPKTLEKDGLVFVREHDMTPPELVSELWGMEKRVFKTLFAGGFARKLYRLYEYRRENE